MRYYTSEYADVDFLENDELVLLTWKKEAHLMNYRQPTEAALELLRKQKSDFVIDARNGFEDEKADVQWGFAYLLPQMSKTGCKNVWFIMNSQNGEDIENEMNMWEAEFSKYFTVRRVESLDKVREQSSMDIIYKDIHEFTVEQLRRLFLSVEWSSGHFPDKLKVAMENFSTVYSAWDGEKLIGMICAMDDGIMNAYVHYLLVDPEYHGLTVGRTLVDMVKEHYRDYLRIAVIAYNDELKFYGNCGFRKADDASPMFITSLWT